jgi:KDO2-lipid IV(A) lauroyltransferase
MPGCEPLPQRQVTPESPVIPRKLWKWRLEWLAQTALEKLAASLPGPVVFRLGESLGSLAWLLMKSRRQIVLRNLRIAFHGEYDLATLRTMARESFRRSAANLLCALHSTRLTAEQIDQIVTVENPELLADALTRGPGVVLMPCHMGNWEILSRINRKFPHGYHAGAFYRPLNNPLLNARVVAQREVEGTRLFSKNDSFHHATAFLKEGGILGILADQRVGQRGDPAPFFGRLTRVSPLPALLARRSRTQVLAMSLSTVAPGKWSIRYHPVNGKISTHSTMDAIERAMKTSPLDVFWLQERWQVYIRPRRTIEQWLGADSVPGTKRHRALLWLAGAPADWQLPAEWSHPDVDYEIVLAADQPAPSWTSGSPIIHTVGMESSAKSLAHTLYRIDIGHALPIDFILTPRSCEALKQAAASESLPVVSLDRAARISPLQSTTNLKG